MTSMNYVFDAIVVGGGPAGSVTALKLAEDGFEVVLIEKNSENKFWYKPSDTLSPSYIEKILDVELTVEKEFENVELYDHTGKLIAEFDANIFALNRIAVGKQYYELLKDAGVKVLTKTEVKSTFLRENPKATPRHVACLGKFHEKLTARLIIDASGLESIIRQELSQIDTTFQIKSSDLMYTLLDEFFVESANLDQDKIAIILDEDIAPLGYIWITPLEKIWRIGIAMRKSRKYSLQLPFRMFNLRKLFRIKGNIARRTFSNLPARRPLEKFVHDGIIEIGEAAFQCAPMYGGGIYGAIKIARELHGEIKKALDSEEYPTIRELWSCEHRLINHLFLASALELTFLYLNRLDEKTRKELIERIPPTLKNRASLIENLFIAFQDASPELAKYIEDVMNSVIKLEEYYSKFPKYSEMNTWMKNLERDVFSSWLKALEII